MELPNGLSPFKVQGFWFDDTTINPFSLFYINCFMKVKNVVYFKFAG